MDHCKISRPVHALSNLLIFNLVACQAQRAAQLSAAIALSVEKAHAIEQNLDIVDEVLQALRAALATGTDWADLNRHIKEEKKAGNPIATRIDSLQLNKNQATLILSRGDEWWENEEGSESEEGERQENKADLIKVGSY